MRTRSVRPLAIVFLSMAVLCAASGGQAATYYVRSGGDNNNLGTTNSDGGAWRTIGKANATVTAGDVVTVISLNPADTTNSTTNKIQPATSGSSGSRITYVGNTASPQDLPVPSIDLTGGRSYITIRGFRAKNGFNIQSTAGTTAQYNVIEQCLILTDTGMRGAQHCRVSQCAMRLQASQGWAAMYFSGYDDLNAQPWCHQDTIQDNTIDLGITGGDHRTLWIRGYTNNCVFARNVVKTTCDRDGSPDPDLTSYVVGVFESFANYFHDNRWDFAITELLDSPARFSAIAVRSGTHHNLWERDTLYFGINDSESMTGDISLGQVSSVGDSQQVYANRWKHCVFKTKSATTRFQLRLKDGLVENCVFINLVEPGLVIWDESGVSLENSIMRHNTFYSRDKAAFKIGSQVTVTNPNTLESNLYLSGTNANCTQGTVEWPSSGGANMASDRSLFYSVSGSAAAAIKVGSSCYVIGPGSGACNTFVDECNSAWANPALVSTTFATFDPSLTTGSPAVSLDFVDNYAGARRDAIRPDEPQTLAVTDEAQSYLDIQWNATGNDSLTGTAYQYDVRYSTSPINESNFASATQVGGALSPASPGTPQSMQIGSLSQYTVYYVAMKVRDLQGNWSALSNVTYGTTTCPPPPEQCDEGQGRPGMSASMPESGEADGLPAEFDLGSIYPNPFVRTTSIEYALPASASLRIEIFDITGRRVRLLKDAEARAGVYRVEWDGRDDRGADLQPGVYFCRLQAGAFVAQRRIVNVGM